MCSYCVPTRRVCECNAFFYFLLFFRYCPASKEKVWEWYQSITICSCCLRICNNRVRITATLYRHGEKKIILQNVDCDTPPIGKEGCPERAPRYWFLVARSSEKKRYLFSLITETGFLKFNSEDPLDRQKKHWRLCIRGLKFYTFFRISKKGSNFQLYLFICFALWLFKAHFNAFRFSIKFCVFFIQTLLRYPASFIAYNYTIFRRPWCKGPASQVKKNLQNWCCKN